MKVSKSYISIQNTAKALFFKFGIKKVTIDEICKESQTSKMTFYRNFKNKEEVAINCVNNLLDETYDNYRGIMKGNLSFKEKFKLLIQQKKEGIKSFSDAFIADIYANPESVYVQILSDYQQKVLKEMEADFHLAQQEGAIRKDVNIKFIIYILNKVSEFTSDEALLGLYNSNQECYEEVIDFLFYGILTDSKN